MKEKAGENVSTAKIPDGAAGSAEADVMNFVVGTLVLTALGTRETSMMGAKEKSRKC